jgi:hypothetical protein
MYETEIRRKIEILRGEQIEVYTRAVLGDSLSRAERQAAFVQARAIGDRIDELLALLPR